ncbi:STAS domain-containing protein [Streptomyces sp. NPDC085614]|uniref:STAS domain-containing protein n=1 Tax=Streptomyces sp. NPDC085614 TaxID=3365733 RepID=UPI0037CDB3C8
MPERAVNLDVEVAIRGADMAVLSVGGELDIETADLLHQHLADQILHGRHHVVLDLSSLEFMDSSGLNVLIRAGRSARDARGDIHLVAPTPAVRRILEITGLTTTTPLHADVEQALSAAGGAR